MKYEFTKYSSGVFCIKTENEYLRHGDVVDVTTKYGKYVPVMIWKKRFTKNRFTYYSYVREDGLDRKEWQARKVERLENAAARNKSLSASYQAKSNKDSAFLSLGEPIKVGHHSEKRHRKIINEANENMRKSIVADDNAIIQLDRAAEISRRIKKEINIDTPESIFLLMQRLEDLEEKKKNIKNDTDHKSFELSNLGANIRRYKQRLETAIKLWDLSDEKVY